MAAAIVPPAASGDRRRDGPRTRTRREGAVTRAAPPTCSCGDQSSEVLIGTWSISAPTHWPGLLVAVKELAGEVRVAEHATRMERAAEGEGAPPSRSGRSGDRCCRPAAARRFRSPHVPVAVIEDERDGLLGDLPPPVDPAQCGRFTRSSSWGIHLTMPSGGPRPDRRNAGCVATPRLKWWSMLDLNQRPPACEAGALPTELIDRDVEI